MPSTILPIEPARVFESLSVFDMFKIGVGPSSSHTMGPWLAATRFLKERTPDELEAITRIQIELFGSLAKTGKGHGTDIAVQFGLMGEHPETIDIESLDTRLKRIAESRVICLLGRHWITFDPKTDIVFHFDEVLPQHPNGMKFIAWAGKQPLQSEAFFSVGGGFILKAGETDLSPTPSVPFPVDCGEDMLVHCAAQSLSISRLVLKNELSWRSEPAIRDKMGRIRETMLETIHRGCRCDGTLPGGLGVRRRAARMARKLLGGEVPADRDEWISILKRQTHDFSVVLDWVSCFALATNEENAAFGRVVTAPTNGAAGVIPAVMMYLLLFCDSSDDDWITFLLTAAEIGCIFKKGATISAAQGGCQAEIGVSSAMAAAGLAECLGGSPRQVTEAAEIAMEHHLGMTCDPIAGLVQIPCIERNAFGAIKAITAARLAIGRDPSEARVSLDGVVRTMWETALDMNAKYKETSEGGLAVQIAVNLSEC
ncbi:L-serine dehydratase 1 [Novipirellula aureliae]|uniref:L-serine dehydratase n=1 Tax=Novipirellula aureliae TaxID=2527966 RepID=A0A5C6DLV0_9BACT|nr:L-serine ammonia-lyase [Novipirellula aureliae]TWU37800.1 L-serine dehydratase 1 [Novipirellula aureliae]